MWVFCQTVKCIKRKERCKRFFSHKYVFLNTAGERQSTSREHMINFVKKLDYLIPKYSCNWILSHRPLHKKHFANAYVFSLSATCWSVLVRRVVNVFPVNRYMQLHSFLKRSIVSVSIKTAVGIHNLEYIISMCTI